MDIVENILIIGSSGVVGRSFKRALHNYKALTPSKKDLDITSEDAINKYFDSNKINFVINCAANRNAELLEDQPSYAYEINVNGPKLLAKKCREKNIKLIHISTDYVFDGKKTLPYDETDITNPLSIYGKTKREGELQVLEHSDTCLILRSAWMFSNDGDDFIEKIINLSNDMDEIGVVFDQVGSPTYVEDFVEYTLQILDKIKPNTKEVYHLTNEGVCSWFDLAMQIKNIKNLSTEIIPILSEDYKIKATRPPYSVLNKKKIKQHFDLKIRHHTEALSDCLKNIKYHK